jgi:hypothetical protein
LKLAYLMKVKGNKILQNVKTCWINMLSPTKWVILMYMPLVAKMIENNPFMMVAQVNFKFFCDVNLLFSLSCLMPTLETIHVLINFS